MSDGIFQYIPTDPQYQPDSEAAERAAVLCRQAFPRATNVEYKFEESVEFVHQGENFEAVFCPECGQDVTTWWGGAMDKAWQVDGFGDLNTTTPCCETLLSLNDLRYEWPAGFARFVISIWNPDEFDPPPGLQLALEASIGHALRLVRTHI